MGVRARSSGREEGPERLVQAVDDKEALLLRHRQVLHRAARRARTGERRGEPLLEGVARREDLGQQEVEQRPQLGKRVLQRRAREQHAVLVRVRVRVRVRVWVRVWG